MFSRLTPGLVRHGRETHADSDRLRAWAARSSCAKSVVNFSEVRRVLCSAEPAGHADYLDGGKNGSRSASVGVEASGDGAGLRGHGGMCRRGAEGAPYGGPSSSCSWRGGERDGHAGLQARPKLREELSLDSPTRTAAKCLHCLPVPGQNLTTSRPPFGGQRRSDRQAHSPSAEGEGQRASHQGRCLRQSVVFLPEAGQVITIITIDVHSRDVIESFVLQKVNEANDFRWAVGLGLPFRARGLDFEN